MKLDRLTVNNFRQFYGRQVLTFARSEAQNVTIVHGVNGAGKTSLFTAINWCLYGVGAENIGSLINRRASTEAVSGATVQASVELAFFHGGERFVAIRKVFADKRAEGLREESSDFKLMKINVQGQAKPVDNPVNTLNAILSEKVRTYFFFDGEKIDNFARPDTSEEIREAIYQVLSLEVLTRGQGHLRDAASTLRREWKRSAPEALTDLLDQNIEKRTELERLKARQQEITAETTATRRQLESIDQRLRALEATRHLQEKLDLLKSQLTTTSEDREQLIASIRDAGSTGYIALAAPVLAAAATLLDEKRTQGEIPSAIREQLVHDLLQRGVCICGRSFAVGDDAHQQLHALLQTAVSGALEDDVLNTTSLIRALQLHAHELPVTLAGAMASKVQLDGRHDSIYAQVDDIEHQFKSSDQDEIQRLGRSREKYQADFESYQVERGSNTNQIEGLTKAIEELDRAIGAAQKKENTAAQMGRRVDLAQRSADALDTIYQTFAEDRRQRIEAEAQRIFRLLVWKDSHFQGMSLDRDYKLEVYDHWGHAARPELSAGERQVLSLAFITAMAQVSGEEAPLVMDTPFGRLSSAHRDNITANIPQLAPQLILFVTDEELRGQSLENLKPRIGAEYQLVFDHQTSSTMIEES